MLETSNVALDTNFFKEQNYLDGNLIKEFAKQGKKGRIKLFITDIVEREIFKLFRLDLSLAKSRNISSQARKLYILNHFDKYRPYTTLPEIDIEEAMNLFESLFTQWS